MPSPPPRHDRYGRPVPQGDAPTRQELAESPTNRAQRARLLRPEVSAEVTITFKVVRGTIQDDVYVGIVRRYRREEA